MGILRLDPFHPPHLHAIQGLALYMLRRYREAVTPLSEAIRRSPRSLLGRLWLTATLVRLGEGEEARAVAAELLRRWPRTAHWLPLMPYRNPRDAEHMTDALREAGIS